MRRVFGTEHFKPRCRSDSLTMPNIRFYVSKRLMIASPRTERQDLARFEIVARRARYLSKIVIVVWAKRVALTKQKRLKAESCEFSDQM